MTYRVDPQSPLNIWETRPGEDDRQVAMATTDHKATELVRLANLGAELRDKLAHHLNEAGDPCQDRGVNWPCDVAIALGEPDPSEDQ